MYLFVERDAELMRLKGLLSSAIDGDGAVAIISGAVGSGKTALLETCSAQGGERACTTVTAVASVLEQGVPLAVLGQLLQGVGVPGGAELADRAGRIAGDLAGRPGLVGQDDVLYHQFAGLAVDLCAAIVQLAETTPLVIGIDDLHHADPYSQHFVQYLARRVGSAPILLVVTEVEPARSALQAELSRLRHCELVRLGPLSAHAVERLLTDRLGDRAARLAADCHAATAGNPSLVHALIEDVDPADPRLTPGTAFRLAAVAGARRGGDVAVRVSRGVALLDRHSTPKLLGWLLGLDPATVTQSMRALAAMGLLDNGRFRHPAARLAVLEDLAPPDRSRMHHVAAELLHDDGAGAIAVAEHLLAAGECRAGWTIPVLEEAAEGSLGRGETTFAVECLKLVGRVCDDDEQRAVVMSKLALIEWRFNPASAERYFPVLINAHQDGHLRGRYAAELLRSLLWHGRFEVVARMLEEKSAKAELDAKTADGLRVTRLKLSHTYPSMLRHLRPVPDARDQHVSTEEQAAELLAAVLGGNGDDSLGYRAEQILATTPLSDTTMDAVQSALLVLVYGNKTDSARMWCDRVLGAPSDRMAPTWRAIVAVIRAEIALREGDLPGVEAHAKAAFAQVAPPAWGVVIGAPLGSLIFAKTGMGQYDAAAELLQQQIPRATFETRCGLHYLHARGHHFLATGHPRSALNDFLACGELMGRWRVDVPALVPWRTDAADAYLRLGEPEEARRLAERQLVMPGVPNSRAHGIALRIVAATLAPGDALPVLRQAADVLTAQGDRLELTKVLIELARVQRELGDHGGARTSADHARSLITTCGAEPLRRRLGRTEETGSGPVPLSEAEARVAHLAARGHTNREIANLASITVSTVEQHLTSVYRKLGVKGRAELATHLRTPVSETA